LKITGLNPLLKDKQLHIDARRPFRRWSQPGNFSESSGFVQYVGTLATAGGLTEITKSVQELSKHMEETDAKIAV
jgi:hypothetical protein